MDAVFYLPDLGEGLEDAEILEWKVAEGDAVELNQPIVEVNTAKAVVEIPSPMAGVITALHGRPGDVIAVGAPLVTFAVEEAAQPTEGQEPRREAVLVGYGVDPEAGGRGRRPKLTPPGGSEPGVRASPPVRRLAQERGVDLAAVTGTGPGGRITREDVLQSAVGPAQGEELGGGVATEAAPELGAVIGTRGGEAARSGATATAPGTEVPEAGHRADVEERVPVRGVRRLIAEKMARSWREIPHVTTFHSVDATHVESLRQELTDESGTKVSALAIVARALVQVCVDHPKLNASFDADAGELVLKRAYHVGIATDTERGLVVPVVRDADRKRISEIAGEIAELSEAARDGRATPEQLTGSTITLTNVGTFGSSFGTPIINHPEVAILALGRIEPRPLVVHGRVEARPAVTLSLSFDHRVIDGADADRAMTDLRKLLESPFRLGSLPR